MKYSTPEIEHILSTMKVIVDTREHDIPEARARWAAFGCPFVRTFLNFGDYSAFVTLPDDTYLSLEKAVVIERKMDLDELASCFGSERKRFTAEFERAKAEKAKIYLLIEDASWEQIYNGEYRSKMFPSSLMGSLTAFMVRYNCHVIMCKQRTSGKLIAEILRKEFKERLENQI